MSDYQLKENSGSIFSNDQKGNEKAPNYKGKINVEGTEFQIALWVREGKSGKYFSAKIEKPTKKVATSAVSSNDGDLPF